MTTEAWPPPPVAAAAATTTTMPIAGRCLARVLLRAAGGAIECSRLRCIDVDIDETVAVFFICSAGKTFLSRWQLRCT